MTGTTSKALAIGLLAVLVSAGGVVGYVLGQRSGSVVTQPTAAPAKMKRFAKRLGLSAEQEVAVSKVLAETRSSVSTAQSRGQTRILELLDDGQKVRYRKMLERQKERREKRRGKRDKRKRRQDKQDKRGGPR